jgi:2-oxoisovalerate dehydrogenase E1 component
MVTTRLLDEAELRLKRQSRVFFQVGSAGHEAVQAAAALLLRPGEDWFYPYYRDRTLVLGLGVSVKQMLLQTMGKASDPSTGGREMPCHFGNPGLQIVNQSSPTGSQYLQAVGTAEAGCISRQLPAFSRRPSFAGDELVYVSGGDGSTSGGEFYEAVCAAVLKKLPVLFLVEDNGYAISVPAEEQTPGGSISQIFASYPDLCVEEINGTDLLESYHSLRRAIAHCRAGKGPALVHARVVRLCPHSDSDDDLYRLPAEKAANTARDPLRIWEEYLVQEGAAHPGELRSVHEEVEQEIARAIDEALAEPDPDPSTATRFVLHADIEVREESAPEPDGDMVTMVQAINRALEEEMARDPRVVVFGEDVADASRSEYLALVKGKGGVFGATQGLQRRFGPHRVFNTPIAEAAIVGRALGMAIRGLLPVAEIQFFDYIWPAMNQIRSELSTLRWRSNNSFCGPLVLRVPVGGYLKGAALYHSQSGEAIFCHCPGLRVVMPSNARDAVGLLRASIRSEDPVLFFEHKHLYRQRHARAPYPGPDYVVPFARARTVRPGRHVTVVTYGALVEMSRKAAEILAEEGVESEVIDLRSLLPYDWGAIASSVKRTGRLVVAYEESRSFGFGAEIAARAAEELFDSLDAPVGRVASKDAYVAYSPVLERAVLPQVDDVVEVVRRTARY